MISIISTAQDAALCVEQGGRLRPSKVLPCGAKTLVHEGAVAGDYELLPAIDSYI